MSKQKATQAIEVLLVDDSPSDVRLIKEALKEGNVQSRLSVVEDGVEAMRFLKQQDQFATAPRPDLIILDLNLPRKDGREVLSEIKNDERLKQIPVVVLSTSRAKEDILRAYDLNANCYVSKPLELDEFMKAVKAIEDFWLLKVQLPQDNI